MLLKEEDKQMLEEQVLDLNKEVNALYEILSHLESIKTHYGYIRQLVNLFFLSFNK